MNRISLAKTGSTIYDATKIFHIANEVASTFMGQNGTTETLALIVCAIETEISNQLNLDVTALISKSKDDRTLKIDDIWINESGEYKNYKVSVILEPSREFKEACGRRYLTMECCVKTANEAISFASEALRPVIKDGVKIITQILF